jgi:hypothetical protein
MKAALQNKLFEKYPKIFVQKDLDMTQTSMCWGIACGDGWFNILDTLCAQIQSHVDSPRENLIRFQRFLEESRAKNEIDNITYWERQVQKTKEKIKRRPQIEAVQVKEKYGTLRFYVNRHDDVVDAIIDFAEEMSGCTCDKCGSPASTSNKGWQETKCGRCKGEI